MTEGSILPVAKAVLFDAFDRWGRVNVTRLAAAFSFFAILSLAPSLLFAVLVGSQFLGDDSKALQSVLTLVRNNLGAQTEPLIRELIQGAQKPGGTIFAAVFGLLVTFFSASNLFLQFNESISAIWERKAGTSFVREFLLGRLKAFAGVLAFGLAMIAWIAFDAWVGWIRARSGGFAGWPVASFVLTTLFLTLVFTLLFASRPRGKVTWGQALPGAVVTAVGFGLSKIVLAQYFALSGVFKAYGAAGALVAILLWVYYTSQIVFFGVILTRAVVARGESTEPDAP